MRKHHGTFDIEQPTLLLISGDWTPRQVWNEFLRATNTLVSTTPTVQLFYARSHLSDSFQDPIIVPFLDKPIYHWENWNTCQQSMHDGDRLVFVII